MVGPGIWQETLKNVKKDKCTLKDRNMARKVRKPGKGDTYTVGPGI